MVAPLLAIALLAPEFVLAGFTDDAAVIAGGVASLRVIAVATMVIILAEICASAVAGTGDTAVTFAIEGVFTIVTLAYAWFAAQVLGLDLAWIWSAEIVGWLLVLVLAVSWLRLGYWRRIEI
jgi:Na+-driven multidrug efflux pump